jgi:hypothetical protein
MYGDSVKLYNGCIYHIPGYMNICNMRVYAEVSRLAALSENHEWYSSVPLRCNCITILSQSSELCHHNPLCYFSMSVYYCCLFCYKLSPETFGYTLIHSDQKELTSLGITVELLVV